MWEPLLAVADAAGGDWPARARAACVALVRAAADTDSGSLGIRLLADVRTVMGSAGVDRMPTEDLLAGLHALAEAPWNDLRGKPLDSRGLARRLRGYGAHSLQFHQDERKVRGYSIPGSEENGGGLHDAFERYLPTLSDTSGTSGTPGTPQPSDPQPVPDAECVPVRDPVHGTHEGAPTCGVPGVPDVPLLVDLGARTPTQTAPEPRLCPECGQPVPAGIVRHPACYIASVRRDKETA